MATIEERVDQLKAELAASKADKKSQTTVLIEIAESVDTFHDEHGMAYAILEIDGHREVWPVMSAFFREWLAGEYYGLTHRGAGRNSIRDANDAISARARFSGECRKVGLRVAERNGHIYVDLADDQWRVVEVDVDGWRVLTDSPVMFRRTQAMEPLPIPVAGTLDTLWRYLNVQKQDRPLIQGFLQSAYSPGPYIHLALLGEQGTAKSTGARMLRSLVDPSGVPLKAPPKDEEGLLVGCINSHVVALDNLSGVQPWLSDALCRLATGGGFSRRTLYTDADETLINVQRPAILNGIDDIATRPDLSERTITIQLEPLRRYVDERDLWRRFDGDRPGILGSLFDSLSAGLRHREHVQIKKAPRMADAARWITACEHAAGYTVEAFLNAYRLNQTASVMTGLEASAVAAAVMALMKDRTLFEATPTELHQKLTDMVSDDVSKSRSWPKSPDWCTKTLRRHANSLRQVGIEVHFDRDPARRAITLSRAIGEISRQSRHGVINGGPNDANDANDASSQVLHANGSAADEYLKASRGE